jgi:class 3 adenylate cyclase/tetratricopeptide (TPR) repeat protein
VSVCPDCRTELPDDARFCLSCGARLAEPRAASEERKTVTTLFCDLVAFTAMSESADPEDVDALLGSYHEAARKVIESHGGTVEKFIGDAVVGVFGVPAVHEDDPERAVRAALRILEALEGLSRPDGSPLEARCGVNTGEALVRLGVDPSSGRGFLTGDAVNVAARLQSAAPASGVAVGALTHLLTRRSIAYEGLPPVAAKGKAEPVEAWRAIAPVARTGIDIDRSKLTPFVGRGVELERLRALLEAAVDGICVQSAVIVGEAGIGKTRLVRELFAALDACPEMIAWRQGRCPSYGEGIAFAALAEIVKGCAGIRDTDRREEIEAKIDAAVSDDPDRDWMTNRLHALVGLDAPQADREENFTAWRRFLESQALDAPLIVVFEDLHWADAALLAFIEYLASDAHTLPLLLVCTTRPELFEQHPQFAQGSTRMKRISLDRLTADDTRRLLGGLVGDARLSSPVVADIVERSAGNPFFAEESARLFGDRRRDGPVPASVQAVVAARLDGLPAEQKAVLTDAAVVGEVFWNGCIAALDHGGRDAVDRLLFELAGKRLVRLRRASSMGGDAEYAFVHALVRDVAYAALPRRTRAAKHARAADWIEARTAHRKEDAVDLLAYHRVTAYELARDAGDAELATRSRGPAVTALRTAGERAMRLDVEAAEKLLAKAVGECGDCDAQRPDLFRAWGGALLHRGRKQDAKAAFEESVRGFIAAGRMGDAAMAMTDLQLVEWESGDQKWSATLQRAFALTERDPESEARAVVLTSMAGAAMGRADYATALDLATQAIDIYHRHGMMIPLAVEGIRVQSACGRGDAAAAGGLRSMARLLKDKGSAREAAVIYANSGTFLFPFEGPRGFDLADEGIDFMRSRGITFGLGLLESNQCWGLFMEGRLDDALIGLNALGESLARRDDQYALICCANCRAAVLVTLGRGQEAFECASEVLERAGTWDDPGIKGVARSEMALALSMLGEDEQARQYLQAIAGEPRVSGYQGDEDSLPELMRCAVHLGESQLIARLCDGLEPGMPLMENIHTTARALVAESAGETEAAAAGFAEAVSRWHDFGVPYEEGHALFGRGRCLVALGRAQEARPVLARARDFFLRIGAKPALEETETYLGNAGTA